MKDKPLYEVAQIKDLRELIKNRVQEHPENPCFLVKEQKGGEYVPIMPDKYDKDIGIFIETTEEPKTLAKNIVEN